MKFEYFLKTNEQRLVKTFKAEPINLPFLFYRHLLSINSSMHMYVFFQKFVIKKKRMHTSWIFKKKEKTSYISKVKNIDAYRNDRKIHFLTDLLTAILRLEALWFGDFSRWYSFLWVL